MQHPSSHGDTFATALLQAAFMQVAGAKQLSLQWKNPGRNTTNSCPPLITIFPEGAAQLLEPFSYQNALRNAKMRKGRCCNAACRVTAQKPRDFKGRGTAVSWLLLQHLSWPHSLLPQPLLQACADGTQEHVAPNPRDPTQRSNLS